MGVIYFLFLVGVIPGIVIVGSVITFKWFGPMLYKDKRAGCKYCLAKFPLIDEKGLHVQLVYGVQMISNEVKVASIEIGYCPKCGRKLE